jgi:hypothetical protein
MGTHSHEWSSEGHNILTADRLAAIREVLEKTGPVIVEHWFYYGGCSPERLVFEDYDELVAYITSANGGDAFHVWNYAQVCRDDNGLVNGKRPDSEGRVPLGGSY